MTILRPYQEVGVNYLRQNRYALLADEMGLGKTVQTIFALPEDASALVVCPATVKGVWRDEISLFRPSFKTTILQGRNSLRFPAPGEIVVTNYDNLPLIVSTCEKAEAWATAQDFCKKHGRYSGWPCTKEQHYWPGVPENFFLIGDEIHKTKNPKSRTTKAWNYLRNSALKYNGHIWGLTGTPIISYAKDMYTILENLNLSHYAYDNWSHFCKLYGAKLLETYAKGRKMKYWEFPKDGILPEEYAKDRAYCFEKVSLRRRKSEVLKDLPAKTISDIEVTFSMSALKECDDFMEYLNEKEVSIEELVLGKSKIPIGKISKFRAALAAAKMNFVEEFISSYEENETPLVVFSSHRFCIDKLGERFDRESTGLQWRTITGDLSAEQKFRNASDFQDAKFDFLACTTPTAGVGITLHRASTALFIDLDWSPSINMQAIDRLHRMGQKNAVQIVRLIGNHHLELRVLQVLDKKMQLMEGTYGI